ncbi:uncharacterized protein YndB with AHSA1/START domain [Fontibacillus phaseoli]|uniref:Uncharacterized protein YndB with AHSA1/START domain n=1 Tax=Fontibacillus phaseoli TaxID=1416533 RepID=A0A369BAY7_9BACL|nr:SRPBCC domain-containing protein [Fontibacillus phaseoli]RCX17758.1 uncharacterized protein YndB with AHSA1/START domain [Fontibacillus phaseoli]
MSNQTVTRIEGNEFILERIFDAPRGLVFKAFTEAEHLKHWWGPRGWTLSVCNVDLREGGAWHYCMKCIDENITDFYGMESWGKAVYKEIAAGEKIVYMDYFSDEEGRESDEMPATEVTLIFEDHDGKTKVTSRGKYDSEEGLQTVLNMGMEQGILETWDRLAEHLQSVQ